jgi:hypothetical protein
LKLVYTQHALANSHPFPCILCEEMSSSTPIRFVVAEL